MTMARQFETAITPHAEAFAAHGIVIAQIGGLIAPFETASSERRQRDRWRESLRFGTTTAMLGRTASAKGQPSS